MYKIGRKEGGKGEGRSAYSLSDTDKAGEDCDGDLSAFADGVFCPSWQVHYVF